MEEYKILAVGDVVAEPGIKAIEKGLEKIKEKYGANFVIVNVENSAEGLGLNKKSFDRLKELPIDSMTLGNHTWAKMDVFKIIGDRKIVRPANLPSGVPGRGYRVYEKDGLKIAVVNLLGRVSMGILSENPFLVMEKAMQTLEKNADIVVADFHGEATAEKIAFAKMFAGRIPCIFGTHTHVQTADETILEGGTGYITDLGMTGTPDGVLGMKASIAIKRFTTTLPERYVAEEKGDRIIHGVVYTLTKNEKGKFVTTNIERIKEIIK